MRTTRLAATTIICLSLAVVFAVTGTCDAAPSPGSFREGELLVKFRPGAPADEVTRGIGATKRSEIPALGIRQLGLRRGTTVENTLNILRKNPNVEFATPNHVIRATQSVIPNDPIFGRYYEVLFGMLTVDATWGFQNPLNDDYDTHATEAWYITTGSPDVTIAIIDSGIDSTHPDLQGRLVPGINTTGPGTSTYTQDDMGHGTFVAGIAGANGNNSIGIAGMDWRASLMPIKVIEEDGYGDELDAMEGIVWAADNGAKVLNMSFGTYQDPIIPPGDPWAGLPALKAACDYAWDAGCVLVAGAGNDGYDDAIDPHYPSAYDSVISVGGTNQQDLRCREAYDWFSTNYGDTLEVMAPGAFMVSCIPYGYGTYLFEEEDYYDAGAGTSASAPFVSGLASLIWGQNPGWTNMDVRLQISATSDDIGAAGWDRYTGWGRINAYRALTESFDQPSIAAVRELPVGSLVKLSDKRVTAGNDAFGDRFYIEEPDRSAGMMVYTGSPAAQPTTEAQVVEVLARTSVLEGQLALVDARVLIGGTDDPLRPLGMKTGSVGGRLTSYGGVTNGLGLTNTGLLVKTSGKVTSVAPSFKYFYVDDGCGLQDGSGHTGLKVDYSAIASPVVPTQGKLVTVIGISTVEITPTQDRIPVLKVRGQPDILMLN